MTLPQSRMLPVFLSVVMPAYNEEACIEQVVLDHIQVMKQLPAFVANWEIVCLDDASTDRTLEIMEKLAEHSEKLRIVRHQENKGIFVSFSDLYAAAHGTHIYATGSDGQWPPSNLKIMLESLALGNDLVIGVRRNRRQVYSPRRWQISRTFNLLPQLLFGIQTVDAGSIKLGIRSAFQFDLISTSAFVEAERIIKALKSGYRIGFVPIDFYRRASGRESGAKWSSVLAATRDCFRCVKYYSFGAGS